MEVVVHRLLLPLLCAGLTVSAAGQDLRLPHRPASLKFAVIGETGRADRNQRDLANQLTAFRATFPFEFVVMLGNNMSGGRPKDYVTKFEQPYKTLLDAGVKFYAALGTDDDPNQRFYKLFNMSGERYYTFKPAALGVRLFALDSGAMTPAQIEWLNKQLAASGSDWKIAFCHRAPREQLEPVFVEHRVNVVLTGHDHSYGRPIAHQGITYLGAGSSGTSHTFMLVEIEGNNLHFQTVDARGVTVDKGTVRKDQQPTK
jgi:hypothetical protein